MEENIQDSVPETVPAPSPLPVSKKMEAAPIAGAIVIAGILIAGAILLKDANISTTSTGNSNDPSEETGGPEKVSTKDRTLGNPKSKVVVIMYEDFQCPFCGAVSGLQDENAEVMQYLRGQNPGWVPPEAEIRKLALAGELLLVYRDFAFLGQESVWAAEGARCAGDQGKFWEYHDYLYSHQGGENKGAFSIANLKIFASILGLDQASFDACLDAEKYQQAVLDSSREGRNAGVSGTPKGFILKDGKVIETIDGAESWGTVKIKIDQAL